MPEVLSKSDYKNAVAAVEDTWDPIRVGPRESLRYLFLMYNSSTWMQRRVDSFEFQSSRRIKQRTSLDIALPARIPAVDTRSPGPQPSRATPPLVPDVTGSAKQDQEQVPQIGILPLVQVRKSPLLAFDITIDGGDLPILTARQTRTLSATGLLALADKLLGLNETNLSLLISQNVSLDSVFSRVDLPLGEFVPVTKGIDRGLGAFYNQVGEVQRALVAIVSLDEVAALEELTQFETARPGSLKSRLWERLAFRIYLRRLASNYYITGVLENPHPGQRKVVLLTHESVWSGKGNKARGRFANVQFDARTGWWASVDAYSKAARQRFTHWLRIGGETLGVLPVSVTQEAHAALDARSYHVELVAPPETKIVNITWHIQPHKLLLDAARAASGVSSPTRYPRDELEARRAYELVRNDLGDHPVQHNPRIDGSGHSRAHTVIQPVPLGYALMLEWRMVPKAAGWTFFAALFGVASLVLQWLLLAASAPPGSWTNDQWLMDEFARGVWNAATSSGEWASLAQNRMAIVLAVAGLGATVLASPGEHPMVRHLLMWRRVATLVSTICLLLAATPLLVDRYIINESYLVYSNLLLSLSSLSFVLLALCLAASVGVVRRMVAKVRRMVRRLRGRPDPEGWTVWPWNLN